MKTQHDTPIENSLQFSCPIANIIALNDLATSNRFIAIDADLGITYENELAIIQEVLGKDITVTSREGFVLLAQTVIEILKDRDPTGNLKKVISQIHVLDGNDIHSVIEGEDVHVQLFM